MIPFKVWWLWRKDNINTFGYKILVLFEIIKSPTLEYLYGWYEGLERIKKVEKNNGLSWLDH